MADTQSKSAAPEGQPQPPSTPPPSSPPPRGPRLRVIFAVLVFSVLALVAGVQWSSQFKGIYAWAHGLVHSQPQAAEPAVKEWYSCGMDPWVYLPKPGPCPVCHMPLAKVDPAKLTGQLTISPVMAQNIGIRIAPVTVGPLTRVIRTVGSVDYDERLVRDVNLKTAGWVEKLYIDYTGKDVKKGDALLDIYSPELYTAQEEYLAAFKARGAATRPSGSAETNAWNKDLLDAARKRLENLDISAQQIAEIERSGRATKTMALRSPYAGLVVNKNVYEGAKIDAGTQLFRIVDLSKVWIMVTLYEYQLPFVQLGQKATISLPYIPGQSFEGKVSYIYPFVNPELRQVKLRVEVDNPNLLLKPGMFTNVELSGTLARDRILVPRQAVVNTGDRQVVFVSLGEGRFDPRHVKLGEEGENGMVEIIDGIKAEDKVVISGNFLLDSEANQREALAKMIRGEMASEQKPVAAVAGMSELTTLPEPAAKALAAVLDGYFAIGENLTADTAKGNAESARMIASGLDGLTKVQLPENPQFWQQHTEVADARAKATELVAADDLAKARLLYADLTTALDKLVKATGVPPSYGKDIQALHCPMFRVDQGGAWWLQPAGTTRNPYMGQEMPMCKDDKHYSLPVTGAKPAATTKPAAMTGVEIPDRDVAVSAARPEGILPSAMGSERGQDGRDTRGQDAHATDGRDTRGMNHAGHGGM